MAFNQDWEHVAVVGKGGSSTVYKALIKSTGGFVAVKQIEIDGLSKDQISGIKGEIETMKDLSHPNILRYLGTQQSPNRVFIFLEYADRGSLRHFYSNRGPLSESQITFCLQGIVAGLNYLHENGIAHRDIKCANCLLGSEGVVKLADFGASKRFESDSIVSGLKGTPHWMAPEVIKGTQMTTGWMKADVWSLGCTVVEMFTAKVPYAEYENPMTAMYKIASGEVPSFKPSTLQPNMPSEDLVSFIHTCCAVEPATRPGAEQLLKHALLVRAIDTVGDLFVDTSLAVGTEPVELPIETDVPQAQSPTMLTQQEKENNKLAAARRSLEEGEAALHEHYHAHHNTNKNNHHESSLLAASFRPRSDSATSVLSGNDDDETTIANLAETSYLEDDFCSYGYEEIGSSRSRGESLGLGNAAGIGFHDCDDNNSNEDAVATKVAPPAQGVAQVSQSVKESRPQARLTPLSVPRASSNSRSNSRSRGKSPAGVPKNGPSPRNAIAINTSSTTAVDLDASVGSDMDEVATPSVFRDNGRSASMQMQMQSLLHEQVGGMTLLDSAQQAPAPLVRKWSATAFPEDVLPRAEQTKPFAEHSPVEDLTGKEPIEDQLGDGDVVSEIPDFPMTEVMNDHQQQVDANQSEVRSAYNVPVVPSFEHANEVYKNMLLKYSPRGVRTSRDAPLLQQSTQQSEQESDHGSDDADGEPGTAEIIPSATVPVRESTDDVVVESTEMLVSPLVDKATERERNQQSHSASPKMSTPTQRSVKAQEPSLKEASDNNTKPKNNSTKSRDSPLAKSNTTASVASNHIQGEKNATNSAANAISETSSLVSSQGESSDQGAETIKPTQRSKTKQSAGLAPLDAGRARAMDPQRRQQVAPIQPRPVAPVTDPVQIRNRVGEDANIGNSNSNSRPYAPLSGEKLRLHSFADPKKALSLGGDGAPGSSAEALERIVNQSGAAAVRKNAAQELREVRTHKAKGSLSHHVIKATKRPRNQASPRHQGHQQLHGPAPAAYGSQPSNQLGSAHGQNRVTAHMGMSGGALLLNNGGVRSQSAGVTSGYSGGSLGSPAEPRKDTKLPPVLRGMNRNAIGSSSGSIDPIEEGRVPTLLRLDGTLNGPTSRYIQSAPAVSRSLNLPPINAPTQQGQRTNHRHGASVDSNAGLVGDDSSDESAYLMSQTPKTKQPRLHNFGRPTQSGTSGVSAVLQQSFANVMKTYATSTAGDSLSPSNGAI